MRRGLRNAAFLGSLGASGGGVSTTGLLGYWKFDGNTTDSFGTTHLTESGAGDVVYDTGILGQAAALDGPLNTLGSTSASGLNTTEALTFACWTKVGAGSTTGGQLGARTAVPTFNGSWGVEFYTGDRIPSFRLGGTAVTSSGGAISTGAWHHIVATYDRTSMKIYVDGTLVGTQANTAAVGTSGNFYVLGGLGLSNVYIDEVSVWSRALSQADVTALYNGGLGLALS